MSPSSAIIIAGVWFLTSLFLKEAGPISSDLVEFLEQTGYTSNITEYHT